MVGRDAQTGREGWINPLTISTVTIWTDRRQERVATVELVTGASHDLREPASIDCLIRAAGIAPRSVAS
jgi:hypothetical protein